MSIEINGLDKFLGKKIKLFRHKMDWSLKVAADNLGVSLQQVQRYEEGVNKISASLLYKLAKALDTPITCFFEGFNEESSNGSAEEDVFNILLVEDDTQDEFIIRKSLEDFPKKLCITSINNGKQALAYFRDLTNNEVSNLPKPQLIMLDLNLPDMQGLDILRDIKRKPQFRSIPVIIITNSNNHEDVVSSYSLQASGFIRKSFSFEDFKRDCQGTLNYWSGVVTLPQTVPQS